MTEDLAYLSATRLIDLYRKGKLSPVEVVATTLQRLETYEGALNGFVLYDPQTAMAMARAAEARWRKGEPLGLLDGIPVAIKDTVLAKGWPRRLGSRTTDPAPSREDSPVVARLRAAGAVFFGKTTTPEFGWKAVTDSPLTGVTRNPWNLERTPGGSSGGSAVALLAGVAPLAVGTDGGGSIRIPAAFCGIVGFKPTFGRVAFYPPALTGDLTHVGPMARSVEDAALMLDAIKGPDPRDWTSLPDDGIRYRSAALKGGMEGKRIALSPTLGLAEPVPEVRAAIERAAGVLAAEGAIVEPADPFDSSATGIYEALVFPVVARFLKTFKPEAVALMDPGFVSLCREAEAASFEGFLEARTRRAALGAALRSFFESYDFLLSPTMPIPAPFADPRSDDEPNPDNFPDWTPYTPLFNLTQNPALSIPCGFTEGLPIGLQIVGPLWGDLSVLQAGAIYEKAVGAAWPSAELTRALATIATTADAAVKAKIWKPTN